MTHEGSSFSSPPGTADAVPPAPHSDAKIRRVHVETWGCQMNTADSERMLALLEAGGYALTDAPETADLVLLNTCHIREKARHKVLSRLGILRQLKAERPEVRIAVAGCVAQADGARLLKAAPEIDVLLGPGRIDDLPQLLAERERTGTSTIGIGFKKNNLSSSAAQARANPTATGKHEVSRFVTIQNGCNNYCTFCVVPFTRGQEVSRPPALILDEARALIEQGVRELTLLGQNVNSYGTDLVNTQALMATQAGPFVDLLLQVAALPGLSRLRFTSSNPHDFTEPLASLFQSEPKLGRYMHLPVQAGSDRTLERMKRKVTVADYRERLHWLRTAVPDIAVSTDLIVGFPGETDEDFAQTLALVEEARFSFTFTFKYSPRRNTPAARWGEQVAEDVKEQRLAALNALQDRITAEHHQAEIGKVRPVLFHYQSSKNPAQYYGRTEHYRLVRVESQVLLTGAVHPVRITAANKTAMLGELVDSARTSSSS